MKKAMLVLAMLGSGIPAVANAAGAHIPGTVIVENVYGNYMSGSFNVRFNTAAADGSFIEVANGTSGYVNFFGSDGTKTFGCYVSPGSAMHDLAVGIASGAGDGTSIHVSKGSTYECGYIIFRHSSRRLN